MKCRRRKGAALLYPLLVGPLWGLLVSCDGLSPLYPTVTSVTTQVVDISKAPVYGCSVAASFSVYVREGAVYDHADIAVLRVRDSGGHILEWDGAQIRDWWSSDDGCFTTPWQYYPDQHPDSFPLGSYSVVVDGDMWVSLAPYEFLVFAGGDTKATTGSMYSSASADTPAILPPPSNVTAQKLSGNRLRVSFDVADPLVTDAFLWLYAYDTYLRGTSWMAGDTPINTAGANTYDIATIAESDLSRATHAMLVLYSNKTANEPNNTVYLSASAKTAITAPP